VAKRVAGGASGEAGQPGGFPDCLLQAISPFSPHQPLISVAFSCILAVDAVTCDCIFSPADRVPVAVVTGRWRFVEELGPAVEGSAEPSGWPAFVRQPARPRNEPLRRGERDEPHPTALSGRE